MTGSLTLTLCLSASTSGRSPFSDLSRCLTNAASDLLLFEVVWRRVFSRELTSYELPTSGTGRARGARERKGAWSQGVA